MTVDIQTNTLAGTRDRSAAGQRPAADGAARSSFSSLLQDLRGSAGSATPGAHGAHGTHGANAGDDTPATDNPAGPADTGNLAQAMAAFLPPPPPQPLPQGTGDADAAAGADMQAGAAGEAREPSHAAAQRQAGRQDAGQGTDASQDGKAANDPARAVQGRQEKHAAQGPQDPGPQAEDFARQLAALAESGAGAGAQAGAADAALATLPGSPTGTLTLPQGMVPVPPQSAPQGVPATPPVSIALPAPPASPAFGGQFTDSIRLLAGKGIQAAELRLTPDELGQVDVRIQIRDGRADLSLSAQSPEALAAIQQALPRLAEALAGSGLALGETRLSEGSPGNTQAGSADGGASGSGNGRTEGRHGQQAGGHAGRGDAAGPVATLPPAGQRRGLIDLYA